MYTIDDLVGSDYRKFFQMMKTPIIKYF
jgi:hypothetical protein